jgi:hypothetical protein
MFRKISFEEALAFFSIRPESVGDLEGGSFNPSELSKWFSIPISEVYDVSGE